ncbi:hypothetical protein H5410_041607 [Solanum commersonii]|uniref:Uncharacterized protein n=1 Tax=Solanum commersonii TaxID=4109 RepID=A0A9J5XTD3_SOLCO|nr:hypothetical protein H5410_041607 [Solanum commersonii]
MCETFNSWILGARFKSIITMLKEIRVKVMEIMNQMREFSEKWTTNVLPIAMEDLKQNVEIADDCEVKFNGDLGFQIHDPPYKHEPYLKAYNMFIQLVTNIKMWLKSRRPTIEPPEITFMPGRPGKKGRRDSNELVKKKFGKTTRKGRKMKCSLCKTFGHNKKGCPALKNVGTSTELVEVIKHVILQMLEYEVNQMPISATSSVVRVATASASSGRPTNASSSGVRAAIASTSCRRPTNTSSSGSKNTNRVLHSATLSSSTPTNIDLGYKPNGLRWKGRAAVTQRIARNQITITVISNYCLIFVFLALNSLMNS